MTDHYYALIMAGGGGTRLWPLSRRARPKQMLQLIGERTLFQIAVDRLEGLFPPERILIVTAASQAQALQEQAPEIPADNYLLEPEPRGTASAIGLAAMALHKRDPDTVMAVLTADHYIGDVEAFHKVLKAAEDIANEGHLVTLGIQPTFASTGYGYIQQGEKLGSYAGLDAFQVVRFKEKPAEDQAKEMLESGGYTWNSGMFIWQTERILAEFSRQMPKLSSSLENIAAAWGAPEQDDVLAKEWGGIKSETIDYGIMENADDTAVIPAADLEWNDVGSWDALFDVLPADADGNIVNHDLHINVGSKDIMVHAENEKRLVVTIGVKDLVIVDTDDVLLVCSKDNAEEVRQAIEQLKAKGQEQYL